MRKILILFLIPLMGILFSCKTSQSTSKEVIHDTIYIETIRIDTIYDTEVLNSLANQLFQARDSIKLYRDSIPYQDYINGRRAEKIKYYISLCEKNANNKKFFYGWIKRVMSE